MINFTFRSSFLLKDFTVWVFLKCAFFILWIIAVQSQGSVDSFILDIVTGFLGFIAVWIFGSVASSFVLISICTIGAYTFILLAIRSKNADLTEKAKKVLWGIFFLSLFTLWVEPFIALVMPGGTAGDVIGMWVGDQFNLFFMIFDPFISALWFFTTLSINKALSSKASSPSFAHSCSTEPITSDSNTRAVEAVILSIIGCGYFSLHQIGKGTILILLLLMSVQQSTLFVPIYLLSVVDVYRLAQKLKTGRRLGRWSVCWNPYTMGNTFVIGVFIAAILFP